MDMITEQFLNTISQKEFGTDYQNLGTLGQFDVNDIVVGLINKEIEPLKQKLFNGDMFKVFTDKELMSEDYKKYDRLLKLKMKFL